MGVPRFPQCLTCYFFTRAPEICEGCNDADQHEQEDLDSEGLEALRDLQDSFA